MGSGASTVACCEIEWEQPGSQECSAGTSIHRPSDRLETVDLPFYRPVAPRLRDGVPNCIQIRQEREGEVLHPMQAAVTSPVNPRHEEVGISMPQDGSELHRHSAHPGEVGRGGLQNSDLDRLASAQHAARLDAESGGGDGRDQMPGGWINRIGSGCRAAAYRRNLSVCHILLHVIQESRRHLSQVCSNSGNQDVNACKRLPHALSSGLSPTCLQRCSELCPGFSAVEQAPVLRCGAVFLQFRLPNPFKLFILSFQ